MDRPILDDSDPRFDVERLIFFSDAVIAIAITLLVIQLSIPVAVQSDADLRDALWALAPGFFSFVLTFAVIGLWWSGHHRLTRALAHADGLLVVLNFVLLGGIAFLPFASGVLGQHGEFPSAVMLYAATNAVIASALVGMRIVARRLHLLRAGAIDASYRRRTAWTAFAAGVFAVSIPIAPLSPQLATLTWDLVLVMAVVRAWDERRRRLRPVPAEDLTA